MWYQILVSGTSLSLGTITIAVIEIKPYFAHLTRLQVKKMVVVSQININFDKLVHYQ